VWLCLSDKDRLEFNLEMTKEELQIIIGELKKLKEDLEGEREKTS